MASYGAGERSVLLINKLTQTVRRQYADSSRQNSATVRVKSAISPRFKMEKKLYVGGLSYDTTETSLKDAFSQAGEVVSAAVITDKMSGRSRGFGFVEMATEEGAQKAIDMWNGKELDGRTLIVNEAKPREDRPRRTGGFDRGGSRGGFGGGGGYGGGGYGGGRRDY